MVAAAVGIGTAVAGIAGSAMSSRAQSRAAGSAAAAELAAAELTVAEQRRQYDQNRTDLAPWREYGGTALGELTALYGIGRNRLLPVRADAGANALASPSGASPGASVWGTPEAQGVWEQLWSTHGRGDGPGAADTPTGYLYKGGPAGSGWTEQVGNYLVRGVSGEGIRDIVVAPGGSVTGTGIGSPGVTSQSMEEARARFQTTPGYEFRLGEGLKAIDRGAASRGLLKSGATIKAEQRYGEGLASSEFENYANRLASLAGIGQSATNVGVAAGQNSANAIGNALMAGGNARASGYLARGQADANMYGGIANAFNSGASNYMLMDYLNRGRPIYNPSTTYRGDSYNALASGYATPHISPIG